MHRRQMRFLSVRGACVGLGLALAWCGNRWTARLIRRAEEGQ